VNKSSARSKAPLTLEFKDFAAVGLPPPEVGFPPQGAVYVPGKRACFADSIPSPIIARAFERQ
jgi:hypothetical protein